MRPIISTREDAGRRLAERLEHHRGEDGIVLALPRGGVPVAAEIARALDLPLDLLIVRKIGLPWHPELAYAAVVDGDPPEVVLNEEVARVDPLSDAEFGLAWNAEVQEIERRRTVYLGGRPPADVRGRVVILVDDGLATGTTVRAALTGLRRKSPAKLVLAVPVAPQDTLDHLSPLVDEVVCLATPEPFRAIGLHYEDFHQLTDSEVLAILDHARLRSEATP